MRSGAEINPCLCSKIRTLALAESMKINRGVPDRVRGIMLMVGAELAKRPGGS